FRWLVAASATRAPVGGRSTDARGASGDRSAWLPPPTPPPGRPPRSALSSSFQCFLLPDERGTLDELDRDMCVARARGVPAKSGGWPSTGPVRSCLERPLGPSN